MTRVDNSVMPHKAGKACVMSILGLYVAGDSSVEAAKKAGGISRVAFVDRTYNGLAPFYLKGCTVVRGS
jgi:hypothetical protein